MSNQVEASKIIGRLIASGQIRNYRRSEWHRRRMANKDAKAVVTCLWWIVIWTVFAMLGILVRGW